MIEGNNAKIMLYISIVTLVLSILGFIFGDNVLEKFSGPELNMSSTKVKINLPEKFISTYTNNEDSFMPKYYRVVEIMNEGSVPSKNLRLKINADGDIYDYKIDSTEKINELNVSDGKITTELKRLSPNAKISIEFWLNDSDKTFQLEYADDNNSGLLKKEQDNNNTNKIYDYIMIIFAILSSGIFAYSKYYLSSRQKIKEVSFENQELENQVNTIIDRLKEETNNNLEEKELVEEKELYKRLEAFIKNTSSL
jgi:hypothetical protein